MTLSESIAALRAAADHAARCKADAMKSSAPNIPSMVNRWKLAEHAMANLLPQLSDVLDAAMMYEISQHEPQASKPVPGDSCGCLDCLNRRGDERLMIACAICGNKRCPKSLNHLNQCTGSNETGQAVEHPARELER